MTEHDYFCGGEWISAPTTYPIRPSGAAGDSEEGVERAARGGACAGTSSTIAPGNYYVNSSRTCSLPPAIIRLFYYFQIIQTVGFLFISCVLVGSLFLHSFYIP